MEDYKDGRRTCRSCRECYKCGTAIGDSRIGCNEGMVCVACEAKLERERKIKKKHEFGQRWTTLSVHDKLKVHGKEKLVKLAAKKGVLKTGSKDSVIHRLQQVTTDADFPIR